MSRLSTQLPTTLLARHEGACLLSFAEAMLKGALEAELEIALIAGPRSGAFAPLFSLASEPAAAQVLRQHNLRLEPTPDAGRALALAAQAARTGRAAFALIPNDELDAIINSLARIAAEPLHGNGALCTIFEDAPQQAPASCPRLAAQRLGLPCIEPADIDQMRDGIDHALRLSRAARSPTGMIIHTSLARTADTLEARPNRVGAPAPTTLMRRRRAATSSLVGGAGAARGEAPVHGAATLALRAARRLELNRFRAAPNPGERVFVGFITVGPADASLQHLTHALALHGRVPALHLRLINPVDEAAVERLLTRCQNVIVLEPRPGAIESTIMMIAENMRRRKADGAQTPASIWGRELPPAQIRRIEARRDDQSEGLGAGNIRQAEKEVMSNQDVSTLRIASDADLHPSILARKIVHLLHEIRPTMQISSQLLPDPPALPEASRSLASAGTGRGSAAGASLGASAALSALRRIVVDVDQWLRDGRGAAAFEERGLQPTVLAIDGAEPAATTADRTGAASAPVVVLVETWEHRRFQQEGIPALVHAAAAGAERPTIFLVLETSGEYISDLERLAQGAIPGPSAHRVRLQVANLADRIGLRDILREAALEAATGAGGVAQLNIIIVRDGPPPQYDSAALEQSLAEIDHLGFEPRQRLVRSIDEICSLRQSVQGNGSVAGGDSSLEYEAASLKTEVSVEPISDAASAGGVQHFKLRLRLQPLLEEVEVVRTRPPAQPWRAVWGGAEAQGGADAVAPAIKLPTPQIVHGKHPQWRVHLAGFRGSPPGLAARILCDAGRHMGYSVRSIHDPTPVAPGQRAWTQVVFGRESAPMALIPYGEGDLLLGLDSHETIRAIGSDPQLRIASPQRTFAVINAASDAVPGESTLNSQVLIEALSQVTQAQGRIAADFAAVCRRWFHSERLADMAMLGAAYQLGFVPVTPDAIEAALARAETPGASGASEGFGRCKEAFELGRRLAVQPELFLEQKSVAASQSADAIAADLMGEAAPRLARRLALWLGRARFVGKQRKSAFQLLLNSALDAMPGLAETQGGRAARRDFVFACYRCLIWAGWGGMEYVRSYADIVVELYRADRGDAGRALTRAAVLPLAEAMLLRDPLYVASVAVSSQQRHGIVRRLNVKRARGDRIERRYLTRIELLAFDRRVRADVRTSDWFVRGLALLSRLAPNRWRGSRRQRELRAYIVDFMQRAAAGAARDYAKWSEAMQRLHNQAVEDRLRGMAIAELRMLLESSAG